VIFNRLRKFSLRNAHEAIHNIITQRESIVVSLDGDDWLVNENVLSYLNKVYQKTGCWLTYGSCLFWDGEKTSTNPIDKAFMTANQEYPAATIRNRNYRKILFLPLHLRTWKTWLFLKIKKEDFLDSHGEWLRFCEDQAMYYPMMEMAGKHMKVISKHLSVYNNANSESDVKTNFFEQMRDEIQIRKKTQYEEI